MRKGIDEICASLVRLLELMVYYVTSRDAQNRGEIPRGNVLTVDQSSFLRTNSIYIAVIIVRWSILGDGTINI